MIFMYFLKNFIIDTLGLVPHKMHKRDLLTMQQIPLFAISKQNPFAFQLY